MTTVYMATVLPGLEAVLAGEIEAAPSGAQVIERARGKVFFASRLENGRLPELRTADNLYRVIGKFTAGPHRVHLPALERAIAAAELAFLRGDKRGRDGFVVNASRRGDHSYSRFEAAEAAARGIAARFPLWRRGTAECHALEFRLDVAEAEAMLSLRLTDAAFRYRGSRMFGPAALRPTVAHALVRLSDPAPDDLFVDVCCGSGTIVAERLAYPYRGLAAGDLSAAAVEAARANLPAGLRLLIRRWNALDLPLDAGSASSIVSNLPFGRQIGEREELEPLYGGLLREMARVLRPGGRATLLAEDGAELRRAAEASGLQCRELLRLSLKGLQPAVYGLRK